MYEVEQPEEVEMYMTDGVFIKQIYLEKKGYGVPQHSHTYDHTTMLARGSVRAWRDGKLLGTFKAPLGLTIPAGTKHLFEALEDETILYCIHNTHGLPREMLEQELIKEKYELA